MCRSGCKTQDHKSWGECARSANIATQWLGGAGISYSDEKEFWAIDHDYREALDNGVDPGGFERADVDAALRAVDAKE
jgi:hypothetical protein